MTLYALPLPAITDQPGDVHRLRRVNGVIITTFPYRMSGIGGRGEIVWNEYPPHFFDDLGTDGWAPPNGQTVKVFDGTASYVDSAGQETAEVEHDYQITGGGAQFSTDPSLSGATLVGGRNVALVGTTLTCNPGQIGGVPTPSPVYQWRLNGIPAPGATSATLDILPAQDGLIVDCTVTSGLSFKATAPLDVAYAPPVANGTAIPALNFTTGGADISVLMTAYFDGIWGSLEIRFAPTWIVASETSLVINAASALAGAFSGEVRAVNSGGASAWKSFGGTATAPVAFANLTAPQISGTGYPGNPHSLAAAGTYSKTPASVVYQWRRRLTANPGDIPVDIAGQTNPLIYQTQAGDVDWTIFLAEIADGPGADPILTTLSNGIAIIAQPATFTLSRNGVDLTFADCDANGTYVDGTPWVRMAGSGTPRLTQALPASAQIARTESNGAALGTGWCHGLAFNPGNSATDWPSLASATLTDRQRANHGLAAGQPTQGLDQELPTFSVPVRYQHSKNLDPGATGQPLALQPGVYVKCISAITDVVRNGSVAVRDLVPFVVLAAGAALPNNDDYPPSPAAGSPAARYRKTQKAPISDLRNLTVATAAPFPTAAALRARFAYHLHLCIAGALGKNVVPGGPGGAHPRYAGDNWRLTEALLAVNTDRYTAAEKDGIDDLIIRYGLWLAERFDQGAIGPANGGSGGGLQMFIAYAAQRLGQPSWLMSVLAYVIQPGAVTALSPSAYAPYNVAGRTVYIDNQYYYYVTPEILAAPRSAIWDWQVRHVGEPQWWDGRAPWSRIDGWNMKLKFVAPAMNNKQGYEHINMMVEAPGILALRVMGASDLLGPLARPMLDATDVYMQARLRNGVELPGGVANDPIRNGVTWLGDAWAQHRGTADLFGYPAWPAGAPVFDQSAPESGSSGQAPNVADNIGINFDRAVAANPGTVTGAFELYEEVMLNSNVWTLVESFDWPGDLSTNFYAAGRAFISGEAVVLNPTANLVRGRRYEVRMAAGAVQAWNGGAAAPAIGTGVIRWTC